MNAHHYTISINSVYQEQLQVVIRELGALNFHITRPLTIYNPLKIKMSI